MENHTYTEIQVKTTSYSIDEIVVKQCIRWSLMQFAREHSQIFGVSNTVNTQLGLRIISNNADRLALLNTKS